MEWIGQTVEHYNSRKWNLTVNGEKGDVTREIKWWVVLIWRGKCPTRVFRANSKLQKSTTLQNIFSWRPISQSLIGFKKLAWGAPRREAHQDNQKNASDTQGVTQYKRRGRGTRLVRLPYVSCYFLLYFNFRY